MENMIAQIIATLQTVEVHGKTNMSRMLGCINALEQILDTIKEVRKEDDDGSST